MDHGRRPHSHLCRCHVVSSGSTEFQKILESEDAGIVIYRYVSRAGSAMQNRGRLDGEVLIVQNTKKAIATSDNLTAAFEQNKLTCSRCIKIMEHAQSMVRHIPLIESGDVVGICENCRRKERPRTSCRCTEIMNKFLSSRHSEERETQRQRIKVWLKRVQHLLQRAKTCQIEKNKPKTRARSELSFEDVFSDFIKSERKDMAEKHPRQGLGGSLESLQTQTDHVRFNLEAPMASAHPKTSEKKMSSPISEDTSHIDMQEMIKHFPSFDSQAADKSVRLPKKNKPDSLMNIFFEGDISKPNLLQELSEKTESKPKRSSILKSQQHIRSRLQREDSLVPERERRRSLSLPWKHSSQEQVFKAASDQDISRSPRVFIFSFPKEIKKEVQHYTSSSELIKTTQDKLNEMEKRKKEEELNKREEKRRINRASKEREEIKKVESARKSLFEEEKQEFADSEKQSSEDLEKQRLTDEKHRLKDEKASITKEKKGMSRSVSPASSKQKSKKVEPTKIEKQSLRDEKHRLQDGKTAITKEKKNLSPPASPASSKPKSKKVEPTKIQETKRLGKTEDDKNALKVLKKPEKLVIEKKPIPKKMEIDKQAMPKKIEEKEHEKLEKSPKNKEDKVQKQKELKSQSTKEEKLQPLPSEHYDKTQVSDGKKNEKEDKKKITAADDSFRLLQAQKERERIEQENLEKKQQKETETATKKAIEADKAAKDTRVKATLTTKLTLQLKDITEKSTQEVTVSKKSEKEEKPKPVPAGDPLKLLQAQKDRERLENEKGEKLKKEQQKETEQALKRATEAEKAAKDKRAKEEASAKLTQIKTEIPAPEIPKPPPQKPELPSTKELSLREVKMKKTSDDLILKLVKLKQSEKKDRERTKEKNKGPDIRSNAINFKKAEHSPFFCDSESDFNEIVEGKPDDELHEIIIGTKLYIQHEPLDHGPLNNLQECVPIPIVETKELEKISDTNTMEMPAEIKPPPKDLTSKKTAQANIEVVRFRRGSWGE